MRAAVLEGYNKPFTIAGDVAVEDPRPSEVLVRVTHCGVCHSDLHMVDGSLPGPLPSVLGHEPAGVVEAVGSAVSSVAPGQHVVLTARPWCGRCALCARGKPWLCLRAVELLTGRREDGTTPLSWQGHDVNIGVGLAAFAEQVVTKESSVVAIPDDVPLEVAAVLGCAVQTGVGAALNTAGVEPGDTVLIVGLGGIGVSIAQGARIAGAARIIGVDRLAERREQAGPFGVTEVIDPAEGDIVAGVLERTGGLGVDHAFEAVGRAALAEACVNSLRVGGTATLVGVGPLDQTVSLPLTLLTVTEKRVQGCLLGSSNSAREVPRLLSLWRAGRLDLEGMITARRPLADIDAAFADLAAGRGLRTVIDIASP
jgi:S-(hydroxymethyl)glutathione dehydrogenase / alcohol dehydrogenase